MLIGNLFFYILHQKCKKANELRKKLVFICTALFHLKLQVGLAERNPAFGCSAPKYLHSFK
jgi:hypothetical protein